VFRTKLVRAKLVRKVFRTQKQLKEKVRTKSLNISSQRKRLEQYFKKIEQKWLHMYKKKGYVEQKWLEEKNKFA
jgi:hypothetical protein